MICSTHWQIIQNMLNQYTAWNLFMKHSQEIVEQIETFDEILYLTEEEGELMNEQEEQFDQYDTDSTDNREDTKEAPPNPKRIRGSF